MPERIFIENANVYDPNKGTTDLVKTDILVEGNRIAALGTNLKSESENVSYHIDATNKVVLPGLINTHDHSPQTFMKDVKEMQNQPIDKWIAIVSWLSKLMDPEAHYHAARVKFLELMLSGVTTTADMVYLYPQKYDHQEITEAIIAAANDVGMRLMLFRGSMSQSQKDGALFPDDVVETTDQIIERTEDIVEKFHDSRNDAIIKIGIAPCTIFTNNPRDFLNAMALANECDITLQTHLSESSFEQSYVMEKYNMTPLQLLQSLGWDSDRVSFAHCIEVDKKDIARLAERGNSVCHCPISNARSPIGQKGIAPISEMLAAGVNIGIGVDGSAGNNSSNLLEEMRWARTISGVRQESTYLQPNDVLRMGTMGGAIALHWNDSLGNIEIGKCADIAIFDVKNAIGNFGTWDGLASLISCQAIVANTVITNGSITILDGHHKLVDEREIKEAAWKKWREVFDKN